MLDLSPMKGIRVDPARRTAEAQAGLTLGEFDHEAQTFGLATTLGVVSMTGIAGLTLGGGSAGSTASTASPATTSSLLTW
jgi:FAD/FMN-containing dehydrogenase